MRNIFLIGAMINFVYSFLHALDGNWLYVHLGMIMALLLLILHKLCEPKEVQ